MVHGTKYSTRYSVQGTWYTIQQCTGYRVHGTVVYKVQSTVQGAKRIIQGQCDVQGTMGNWNKALFICMIGSELWLVFLDNSSE
jgi:hypothetical protein